MSRILELGQPQVFLSIGVFVLAQTLPPNPPPAPPPGSWGCGLRVGVVSFQGFFRVVQDTCMCLGVQILGETGLRV